MHVRVLLIGERIQGPRPPPRVPLLYNNIMVGFPPRVLPRCRRPTPGRDISHPRQVPTGLTHLHSPRVRSPNNGKVGIKFFCPHSRRFGSCGFSFIHSFHSSQYVYVTKILTLAYPCYWIFVLEKKILTPAIRLYRWFLRSPFLTW